MDKSVFLAQTHEADRTMFDLVKSTRAASRPSTGLVF